MRSEPLRRVDIGPNKENIESIFQEGVDLRDLSIDELRPADSPRVAGEDKDHVKILSETDGPLPPILVNRRTMQVVDGMHRLRAAVVRGDRMIRSRLCDVDESQVFVLAVKCNITHGMPLSLTDRRAAACRILVSYPHWSDRKIARVTGLSPGTVGAVRTRSTDQSEQPNMRVGQDGRHRPVDWSASRERVAALLRDRPTSSLREIAVLAGVSPATVHGVKKRLSSNCAMKQVGGSPPADFKESRRAPQRKWTRQAYSVTNGRDAQVILKRLKNDSSLRFSGAGREIVNSLSLNISLWARHAIWSKLTPSHCLEQVAALARATADYWDELADELDRRQCDEMGSPGGAPTHRGEAAANN